MAMLTPNLHFTGDCSEAMRFYEAALGGEILIHYTFGDAGEGGEAMRDRVYHGEMRIAGQRVMMNDGETTPQGNTVSLVVTYDTAGEVRAACARMSEGCTVVHPMEANGHSSCFVSLIDRFGVRWELMTEQTER